MPLPEALKFLVEEEDNVEVVVNVYLMGVTSSSGITVVIYNATITACSHNGAWEEALAVLWRVPDESHYVSVREQTVVLSLPRSFIRSLVSASL